MTTSSPCASAPAVFLFQTSEVRTISRDDEPWFVLSDLWHQPIHQQQRQPSPRHQDSRNRRPSRGNPYQKRGAFIVRRSLISRLLHRQSQHLPGHHLLNEIIS